MGRVVISLCKVHVGRVVISLCKVHVGRVVISLCKVQYESSCYLSVLGAIWVELFNIVIFMSLLLLLFRHLKMAKVS